MKTQLIEEAYRIARERYAAVGVDTDEALEKLQRVSLSLHCWQADDVTGFENRGGELTGGIQATGNYPGKARNVEELRADILKAASYIPGTHRLNLHEIYGEFGGKKVVKLLDYAPGLDGLPKSDVLKFLLEDNCSIVVRPSGTEPKLKIYLATKEDSFDSAEKDLAAMKDEVVKKFNL